MTLSGTRRFGNAKLDRSANHFEFYLLKSRNERKFLSGVPIEVTGDRWNALVFAINAISSVVIETAPFEIGSGEQREKF